MRSFLTSVAVVVLVVCFGCSDDATEVPNTESSQIAPGSVVEKAKDSVTADDLVPARNLLQTALRAARNEDADARLVDVKYSAGERDLRFRSGTFKFNSPARRAAGERSTSLQVNVSASGVEKLRPVKHYWREGADFDADPSEAFRAAMDSEFGTWWQEFPEAGLYMHLRPDSDYMDYRPKNSEWVVGRNGVWSGGARGFPRVHRRGELRGAGHKAKRGVRALSDLGSGRTTLLRPPVAVPLENLRPDRSETLPAGENPGEHLPARLSYGCPEGGRRDEP